MQGKIVECTYSYLRDYGGHDAVKYFLNKRWIWLENRCEFVETKNVALQPKSNFSSNLEPFITILPVKSMNNFITFLRNLEFQKN